MAKNNDDLHLETVEIEEVVQLDLAEEVYSLRQAVWALVKVLRTKQ